MSIICVSTAADGTQANDYSSLPSISADGRYIAFSSLASNLVHGDTNPNYDIFVKDLQTGAVALVGAAAEGDMSFAFPGYVSSISADGRYVAFESDASHLVPGDTNGQRDVFFKDLQTNSLTRVSVSANGTQGNAFSYDPSLSADGRYVAFTSNSSLTPVDYNGDNDVFVRDLGAHTLTRVSVAGESTRHIVNTNPSLSADGQVIAFASYDATSGWSILAEDLQTGELTLVSAAADGTPGDDYTTHPSISADGRYVAFESQASNLVPDDSNGTSDVFVKDLQTGAIAQVSIAADGTDGNSASYNPSISADGRYVAFESDASNFVRGDTNGRRDIFVKDLLSGAIIRVSVADGGSQTHVNSTAPELSADGHFVAFDSAADNLVTDDTNGTSDIFRAEVDFSNVLVGDDTDNDLAGSASDETLAGIAGADTLSGGGGRDVLLGGDGRDSLVGGAGNDTLDGGVGSDRLLGGNGDDILRGGNGFDTLIGGLGRDTLDGGIGNDVFLFKAADNSPFNAGDIIASFITGKDRIDLSRVGAKAFIGGASFTGGDGVVEARLEAAAHKVEVDINDDGVFGPGDLEINGIVFLKAADFILA